MFDSVVVVFSLIEIAVEQFSNGNNTSGLSALRSFRLMRVFRLAKTWTDLQVRCCCVCY